MQSAEKFKDGSLDGYFQTTGYPQGTLSELAATNGFELLPIDGAQRDKIMAQFKFFAKDKIPDGTYKDVKGVETVAVGAQWTTIVQAAATISSTRSPRRCGATRRAPRWTPATPRARTSRRRPRC